MIAIKGMEEIPKCCDDCPLCNEYDHECGINGYDSKTDTTKERMKDCPLVEIVTCKDCKYYRVEDDDEYCTNHTIKDNKFWVREDYFCADAERRE